MHSQGADAVRGQHAKVPVKAKTGTITGFVPQTQTHVFFGSRLHKRSGHSSEGVAEY